jgi:hypothetical protein
MHYNVMQCNAEDEVEVEVEVEVASSSGEASPPDATMQTDPTRVDQYYGGSHVIWLGTIQHPPRYSK